MKTKLNLKRLKWELSQPDHYNDTSVYDRIYMEYMEIEEQLLIDIPLNQHDRDLVQKHKDLNKILANYPPYQVDEYSIFDLAEEKANEDNMCK
jgi:hypothetical protein